MMVLYTCTIHVLYLLLREGTPCGPIKSFDWSGKHVACKDTD